uniref:PsbP C-terminal domain-containing protein n=1 Tax=Coccolithus braarudii TaxID=221442 RepID=A0A7S0L6A4_9EUKA|mmetsp:Transcript_2162/g.4515  ORF Transcript_2162/g.4515 Transcript_2162/m.4515 type:complete len:293 (+) Transcript_2162:132-1010(+)|eukprot:CAMPEP_0183348574 /NCGR_PEP_ID=MMETSP0164_2-20130417/13044_1 /TAXON_ID=221442 /ORGANISM="Coccolithus pelagicus ssp braarudi, Strain PLY182g" /LENGTH=292 /DNA_ID=CAMNT_0025520191 /DNA_START=122 /DNA_END=1000 /DNA_ORIENTATION=+
MLAPLLATLSLVPRVSPAEMCSRRAAVGGFSTLALGSLVPPAFSVSGGVPEGMRTSESYSNLQQISPETTGTLGAGTMSSRSRPVTGVVLLEEVQETGAKVAPFVSAELVLDGGVAATATFQAEYPLNRGMFYDVEVRNQVGDGAFLQVNSLPLGKSIKDVDDSYFTKSVLSTEGRFGAYGAPTDVKIKSVTQNGAVRLLEIAFSALSPGQQEVPRRALVAAVQPEGATDVVMLVTGSTGGRWKVCEPVMRKMASTFRIASVRPTNIKRKSKNDYRFEDQGGLNERNADSVF